MPQERSRLISFKKRVGTFEEVHLGLNKAEAVENAKIFLERERAVKGAPCPLTEDYFSVLKLLAQNDVRGAATKLLETNPLPGVTARLAPEFYSETQVYNRKAEKVSLRAIERFLAEIRGEIRGHIPNSSVGAQELGICPRISSNESSVCPRISPRSKVAIIGSGPAGLTAAAFLVRQGFSVTVFESSPFAGGSLASFYPEFRFPSKVLGAVLNACSAGGVEFELNALFPRTVSSEDLFEEGGFSAVLLAAGAGVAEMMNIPGESSAGVMPASEMLLFTRAMCAGREPYTTPFFLGSKVIVVGHNEMAFDAARTAVRLGKKVVMVIAGAETDIRVSADIVREAAEEGVKFRTFAVPVKVRTDATASVKALVCRHLDYRVDNEGRLTVVEDEDAEFELEADTILVSRGMRANTFFLSEVPGLDFNLDGSVWVKPDSSYTSVRKVFAVGHLVRPAASLLEVMVDARRAASEIAAYLNG